MRTACVYRIVQKALKNFLKGKVQKRLSLVCLAIRDRPFVCVLQFHSL